MTVRLLMRMPPEDITLTPGAYVVKTAIGGALSFESVGEFVRAQRCEICKHYEAGTYGYAIDGECKLFSRTEHVSEYGAFYVRRDFGCVQWEASNAP